MPIKSTLQACINLVLFIAVTGCESLTGSDLEFELIGQVEQATTCSDTVARSARSADAVWSRKKLKSAASFEETRQILDEYKTTLGNNAFTSRWPADRALLIGRLILERLDSASPANTIAQNIERCVKSAMAVHPAAAWELRGRLNSRRSESESKSLAYYSFSKAANLATDSIDKLRALRLRQTLVDDGLTTCQSRLADYYEAEDQKILSGASEYSITAPDDSLSDYVASWFTTESLNQMRQWAFLNIPRCQLLSSTAILKAKNLQSSNIILTAFGQADIEESPNGDVCDSLDYIGLFNPISIQSSGNPLGWLGSAITNSMQMSLERKKMQNSQIENLLQEILLDLRSNLTAVEKEKTSTHKFITPLTPTLFAREFECRITQHSDFSQPQRFEIDNTPSIVVSSATIRHAMLTATSAFFNVTSSKVDQPVKVLQRRFKVELSFLVAHELAHAYLDGGRNLGISEAEIDCHAIQNIFSTYGKDATLGVFGSSGTALSEGRFDTWRLWSPSTIEEVGRRIRLAQSQLQKLASSTPPVDCATYNQQAIL
nr:hypothetical protein [uncultured Albidiferax sp.]